MQRIELRNIAGADFSQFDPLAARSISLIEAGHMMNTYLLSALMSIHLVYGSVFACDVQVHIRFDHDVYTLSILDKSNYSERAQIVFMDLMCFYQKMSGLKDEYIATMTWISALSDKHLSCKYIRDTEYKSVKQSEYDFTKPDQEE